MDTLEKSRQTDDAPINGIQDEVGIEADMEDMNDELNVEEIIEDQDQSVGGEGSEEEDNMDFSEPVLGSLFSTLEDIFVMYERYAKAMGFCVVKASSKNDLAGKRKYQRFSCHRGRKADNKENSERKHNSQRIECPARVTASLVESGEWKITSVVLNHNHEMSPTKVRFLRQNRRLTARMKRRLVINDYAGIRIPKTYRSLIFEEGGNEKMPCLPKDCRNYVEQQRKSLMGEGDANAVANLFAKMQESERSFFYLFDTDEEGRVKRLFWADGRSRAAYREFCDVISFDTTYLINRYQMPFAPFIGVNHHGQSILLGCALISDEKAETFEWVFKSFLSCMQNKQPNGIITDQCPSIGAAVKSVFLGVRHRLCLWHIMSRYRENMKSKKNYNDIKEKFKECVYDTTSIDEFEKCWGEMVEEFNLHSKRWIKTLYDIKEKWAPAYLKDQFWAGMSSTQRSESVNAYFDGYVNSLSTLKQFVEQYALALNDRFEKEAVADFESLNTKMRCKTGYSFEKQLARMLTNEIYGLVQKELDKLIYTEEKGSNKAGTKVIHDVVEQVVCDGETSMKRVKFKVTYDETTSDVNCSCRKFEFQGIFCSHIFRVLATRDVQCIPEKYILNRWRKDVPRMYTKIGVTVFSNSNSDELMRLKRMEDEFYELAEIAKFDNDKCAVVVKILKDAIRKLSLMDSPTSSSHGENQCTSGNVCASPHDDTSITRNACNSNNRKSVDESGKVAKRSRLSNCSRNVRRAILENNNQNDMANKQSYNLCGGNSDGCGGRSCNESVQGSQPSVYSNHGNGVVHMKVRDPKVTKRRGRPRQNRIKSRSEQVILRKSKRKSTKATMDDAIANYKSAEEVENNSTLATHNNNAFILDSKNE